MIGVTKTAYLVCLVMISAVIQTQNSFAQAPSIDLDNRSYQNSGLVCTNNDYALCSHANCGCVDENGDATDCQPYDKSTPNKPASWARCECPIVETSNTAYMANYASPLLTCDQREKPNEENSIYKLPSFVQGETTDIYSTYSFGDSLPDELFGTDAFDKGLICDSPKYFTDCLNMACYIPDGGDMAVCYCKNTPVAGVQTTYSNPLEVTAFQQFEVTCPSLSWNTFGGECDDDNCNFGGDSTKIWSGACIDDTMAAMADIYAAIRVLKINTDSKFIPAYCD